MRKFSLTLLIIFLVVLSGAYAEGTSEQKAAVGELSGVDPSNQTITYWHQFSKSMGKAITKLVDEFNATNKWHITVKGEYAGRYNDIYNKMITSIAGNATPDLVAAYQNQAASYALGNALVDLNPYVNSPKWGIKDELSDYFKGFLDQDINVQFGGKRLGFPLNRSLEVLYYNIDWLNKLGYSKPPATWDEFYQMCKKATESGSGKSGYAIVIGASTMFSQAISRGGDIAKADGSGYKLDSEEMAASMKFMQKLYKNGYGTKVAVRYGEQTLFATQKVLFTEGSTAGLPYYRSAINKSGAPFKWSVAALPHTTPKPVMDIYGASVSIPKSTPKKQLAAWLFIKWLAQPKQQAFWVGATNYFPVRKSTAKELSAYMAKNPQYKDAYNLLQNAVTKAEPPFVAYDQVRDDMSSAYSAILDGAGVASTLAKLNEKANKVLKEAAPQ